MDKGGRFREDLPARRPGRLWGIRHQQGLGFLSTPCFFSLTDILTLVESCPHHTSTPT